MIETFDDAKGVIRSRNHRRTDNTMVKVKRTTKRQTMVDKALHRTL